MRKEATLIAPKLMPVSKDSTDEELEAKQNKFLYKAQVAAFVAHGD